MTGGEAGIRFPFRDRSRKNRAAATEAARAAAKAASSEWIGR
jgi:hypothetical protein